MKDPISDNNLQALSAYSKQFLGGSLPEFIKNAEVETVKVPEKAPISIYGNPANATFPCHNKTATFLSNLYLLAGQANGEAWQSGFPVEKVAERLENHAKFWGIWPEVLAIKESITKQSSPVLTLEPADYALDVKYRENSVRRFPVKTAAMVKASAEALFRDRVNYPYEWRKTAARTILNRSAEFNLDLPEESFDYLCKAAGAQTAESTDQIAKNILARALEYPTGIREKFAKVATLIYKSKSVPGGCEKLAQLLDDTDRSLEVTYKYAQGLPLPEEVCFSGLTVKSAEAETITLTNGKSFSLEDIKKAGIEPFTVLGSDLVSELSASDMGGLLDLAKVASIAPTLPRDSARELTTALEAVGVKSIALDKEASRKENVKKVSSMAEWLKHAEEHHGAQAEKMTWSIAYKHKHDQRVSTETT